MGRWAFNKIGERLGLAFGGFGIFLCDADGINKKTDPPK